MQVTLLTDHAVTLPHVIAPPLKKTYTQIEAIAGSEQPHSQDGSTKNGDWSHSFDADLSSGYARKRSCDSGHLISPWLERLGLFSIVSVVGLMRI